MPTPGAKARANFVAERLKGENDFVRGFHVTAEAWYSKSPSTAPDKPEIMFGLYAISGGTRGEMSIKWHELAGKSVPRLEVFDDGWKVLYTFADVLEAMANEDNRNITPKQFCDILMRCGFKDLTERDRKEAA